MQPLPLVTSPSNPLVKQARSLRQRKRRDETGLFLLEGLHHIGQALEAAWNIETLLYAPELLVSGFGQELVQRAASMPLRLQPVSPAVIESLAGKDNPQGMLAVVHQRRQGLEVLKGLESIVALVSPQDPGNVGTILRTIDAAGVGGLALLDGGVDAYHPTAVRASMGTLFWKQLAQGSFEAFVDWARGEGLQLIGTSAHAQMDYLELKPPSRWALVMGSEQSGLSRAQLQACDQAVSLPMRGRASSLNLAVATGILLYALLGR